MDALNFIEEASDETNELDDMETAPVFALVAGKYYKVVGVAAHETSSSLIITAEAVETPEERV